MNVTTAIEINAYRITEYIGHEVLMGTEELGTQRWEIVRNVTASAHQGYDVHTDSGTYQFALDLDGVVVNGSTHWGDSATLDVGRN